MQVEVPLHACVEQAVLVQVIGVPAQVPDPLQTSPYVQVFKSLHVVPEGAFELTVHADVPLQERCWQVELEQTIGVPTH